MLATRTAAKKVTEYDATHTIDPKSGIVHTRNGTGHALEKSESMKHLPLPMCWAMIYHDFWANVIEYLGRQILPVVTLR